MTLLLLLLVFGLAGLVLLDHNNDVVSGLGLVVTLLCSALLFIALAALPLSRADDRSAIEEFRATEATVRSMRERGDDIERAAIAHKVVEANRWLARAQYWNRSWWFDAWTVDEVDVLEAIR